MIKRSGLMVSKTKVSSSPAKEYFSSFLNYFSKAGSQNF